MEKGLVMNSHYLWPTLFRYVITIRDFVGYYDTTIHDRVHIRWVTFHPTDICSSTVYLITVTRWPYVSCGTRYCIPPHFHSIRYRGVVVHSFTLHLFCDTILFVTTIPTLRFCLFVVTITGDSFCCYHLFDSPHFYPFLRPWRYVFRWRYRYIHSILTTLSIPTIPFIPFDAIHCSVPFVVILMMIPIYSTGRFYALPMLLFLHSQFGDTVIHLIHFTIDDDSPFWYHSTIVFIHLPLFYRYRILRVRHWFSTAILWRYHYSWYFWWYRSFIPKKNCSPCWRCSIVYHSDTFVGRPSTWWPSAHILPTTAFHVSPPFVVVLQMPFCSFHWLRSTFWCISFRCSFLPHFRSFYTFLILLLFHLRCYYCSHSPCPIGTFYHTFVPTIHSDSIYICYNFYDTVPCLFCSTLHSIRWRYIPLIPLPHYILVTTCYIPHHLPMMTFVTIRPLPMVFVTISLLFPQVIRCYDLLFWYDTMHILIWFFYTTDYLRFVWYGVTTTVYAPYVLFLITTTDPYPFTYISPVLEVPRRCHSGRYVVRSIPLLFVTAISVVHSVTIRTIPFAGRVFYSYRSLRWISSYIPSTVFIRSGDTSCLQEADTFVVRYYLMISTCVPTVTDSTCSTWFPVYLLPDFVPLPVPTAFVPTYIYLPIHSTKKRFSFVVLTWSAILLHRSDDTIPTILIHSYVLWWCSILPMMFPVSLQLHSMKSCCCSSHRYIRYISIPPFGIRYHSDAFHSIRYDRCSGDRDTITTTTLFDYYRWACNSFSPPPCSVILPFLVGGDGVFWAIPHTYTTFDTNYYLICSTVTLFYHTTTFDGILYLFVFPTISWFVRYRWYICSYRCSFYYHRRCLPFYRPTLRWFPLPTYHLFDSCHSSVDFLLSIICSLFICIYIRHSALQHSLHTDRLIPTSCYIPVHSIPKF